MSKTPTEAYRASPPLGWHTTEILEGCGLTEAEIAAYRAAGVIGGE
jgi:crotonobetainyl-CoA:carnitine CoA-transferase CaiB-like acyl-CoA transferase